MAAEFDILNGFVAADVKKQFDDLNKYAEQSAAKMKELADAKDKIFGMKDGVNNQKAINAIEKENIKLREAQEKSNAKLLILDQKLKNTLEQQAMQHNAKMNKINTEKTGYINELEREVKELTAAYARLTDVELKATGGQQALLNLKNKRTELAGLKAAYGDNRMYVGEYSRGVNGLKQSMTMLAGEMPNFAQSFRIGMMSLSNNWMGLSQAISIAKAEQMDLADQFKKGLIDKKPDSLFKMITKSIFSMNLVLMVAVTVMQLYNEEIGNFIENLFNATNAAQKFTKALNEVEKAASDMLKKDKENVAKFIHDYKLAFKNGDDEMLKQLRERGAKEFDLNQQQLDLIVTAKKNAATDIFDDYLKKAEDAYFDEVIIQKRASAEANAAISLKTAQDKFRAASDTKSVKGRIKASGLGAEKLTFETLKRAAYDKSFANELFETLSITDVGQDVVDELKKVITENEILKYLPKLRNSSYISKLDDPKKPKKGKNYQDIDVKREYYNSEEEMLKRLADLQNDITKENENGELNSYEKRLKAAKLYYETVTAMAMGEQNVAIANELAKANPKTKTGSAYSAIEAKFKNNEKNFTKGSPEDIKNKQQYALALETLEKNSNDAILKINDEYAKKQIAAEKKRAKDVLDVENDIYKEKVYYIESEAKLRAQMEEALSNQQSIGSRIAGGLGLKDNRAFRSASSKRGSEMSTIKEKLKGAKGTDRDALEKELANASAADAQANELEAMRIAEDAKASIASDSIDTLKALWDAYYQYQMEQIDKQLETQTKVNDERVKQYEDEAEAGMHSAKEVSDFKDNVAAYQQSQDEEAARKKAELEKQQFLLQQAFALGQVWINFAIASTSPSNVGGLLTPLLLAQAIASTALIAAQSIPAFKDGVEKFEGGQAIVGDGYKNEFVYNPRTKKGYITPDVPTLVTLDKGSNVYPDINKLDLDSYNMSQYRLPMIHQDDRLLEEMKMLRGDLRRQKTPQINGMRLMQQMQYAEKSLSNRRGLLN